MRQGSVRKLQQGKAVVVKVAQPLIHYEAEVVRRNGNIVTVKVTKIIQNHAPQAITVDQQRDVHFAHIVDPTATPKKKKKKK